MSNDMTTVRLSTGNLSNAKSVRPYPAVGRVTHEGAVGRRPHYSGSHRRHWQQVGRSGRRGSRRGVATAGIGAPAAAVHGEVDALLEAVLGESKLLLNT